MDNLTEQEAREARKTLNGVITLDRDQLRHTTRDELAGAVQELARYARALEEQLREGAKLNQKNASTIWATIDRLKHEGKSHAELDLAYEQTTAFVNNTCKLLGPTE